jgi:uncharacterized protein (TIGR00725 family)
MDSSRAGTRRSAAREAGADTRPLTSSGGARHGHDADGGACGLVVCVAAADRGRDAGADIGVTLGYVALIGPGDGASEVQIADARSAGRRLAECGHVVVTGGLGGVMGGAAAGATEVGGVAVGLLPGDDRDAGHPANSVLIPTGLGELRNGLILRAADVVLAIGGSWGTLSEIAMAVRTGVPTVVVGGWHLPEPGAETFDDVDTAVERVLSLLDGDIRR